MSTPPDEEQVLWTDGVSRLTVEALDAAERGQWDRVEACYQERAKWFRHNRVSPNFAQALLAMDATVIERATAARAVADHNLAQMLTTQRQWKTLSTASRESAPVGGRLDRHS